MTNQQKIPFWIAVLININIVIGSAFFLGAQTINEVCGVLAPFAWLLCGLLLLPLIIVLAKLAAHYPSDGGIYLYSQKILGTFWGFLSGWGYFVGTIAGNAAVVHAFSSYLQQVTYLRPLFEHCGILGISIDVVVVLLFTLLNLLNIQFLERAQIGFTLLKAFPMILMLIGGLLLFDSTKLVIQPMQWPSVVGVFPMVFFAYIGIEACCAVADKIQDGKRSASGVIWISFILIVLIYAILQASMFFVHGTTGENPFLQVLPALTQNNFVINWGNKLVYLSILFSFLGGFYGMFYYNNWNLYAMAQDGNILGGSHLIKLNKNQVPWVCVFVQSSLLLIFLFVTKAHNHYLVTMSDFGVVIAYLLSAISFCVMKRTVVGFLALASCLVLLYISSATLLESGISNLLPFLIILWVGIALFKGKKILQ